MEANTSVNERVREIENQYASKRALQKSSQRWLLVAAISAGILSVVGLVSFGNLRDSLNQAQWKIEEVSQALVDARTEQITFVVGDDIFDPSPESRVVSLPCGAGRSDVAQHLRQLMNTRQAHGITVRQIGKVAGGHCGLTLYRAALDRFN